MKRPLLLEKQLEPVFLRKFPSFPEKVKDFFVEKGPYIMLTLSVIVLILLLSALAFISAVVGFGAAFSGLAINFYVGVIIGIVTIIMYFLAFTPLRRRKRVGWNLLYYALLLGLLSNVIQFSIFWFFVGVLFGVPGFWVLFQIRDKYT